jgi:hypothetical protein
MIIKRNRPEQGIRFAWLPVWTGEGRVWFEYVHFNWVEGWGWGSDGHYEYKRWVPEARYGQGERTQSKFTTPPVRLSFPYLIAPKGDIVETDAQGREFFGQDAYHYATPPDHSKCGKLRADGPTPCHYPHCTCMNVGGSKCPE